MSSRISQLHGVATPASTAPRPQFRPHFGALARRGKSQVGKCEPHRVEESYFGEISPLPTFLGLVWPPVELRESLAQLTEPSVDQQLELHP